MRSQHRLVRALPLLIMFLLLGLRCEEDDDGHYHITSGPPIMIPPPPMGTPSSTVATSDIVAEFAVRSPTVATGPRAYAALRDASSLSFDPISLSFGEYLDVIHNGNTYFMRPDTPASVPRYRATLDHGSPEGPVEILFNRQNGNDVSVTVDLRPPFSVATPTYGQLAEFDDLLYLTWSPAEPGAQMDIEFFIACSKTAGGTTGRSFSISVPDDGYATYDLSLLSEPMDPEIDQSQDCMMKVEFTRAASADIAPPYAVGSTFTTEQSRSVSNIMLSF